jgi:hypothetical protein
MPQILIIGAALAGGFYCWKVLKRELARLDHEEAAVRKKPEVTLEHDPKTGRYRPKDKL